MKLLRYLLDYGSICLQLYLVVISLKAILKVGCAASNKLLPIHL